MSVAVAVRARSAGAAAGDASVAIALAAAAVSLAAPALAEHVQWVVLLVGAVLTGVPHGAIDHLVPGRLGGRPLRPRAMASLLAAYVALAAVGVALWLLAPAAGMAALLVVAALHWGQGEIWYLVAAEGRAAPRDRWSYAGIVAGRGVLPVLGPLAAHPAAFAAATAGVAAPLGGALHLPAAPLGLACAAALAAALLAAWRDGPAGRARDLAELAALVALALSAPPVLAVGLYFVAWHAPRHLARLAELEGGTSRALRAALPCTALALAAVAALAAVLAPSGLPQLAGALLAVIFGLTLPHAIVVAGMDVAQDVLPASRR